jgi:hypothetical protein
MAAAPPERGLGHTGSGGVGAGASGRPLGRRGGRRLSNNVERDMPRRLAASSMRLSTSAITARMCWRPALSRISSSVVGGASYASPAWPEKKRVDADPRRLRKRHRPLGAVAQLPHIAGPGVVEQSLLGFGVKPRTAVAMLTYLTPVRE